jgi:hypothetical protein
MTYRRAGCALLATSLLGCSSIPETTLTYYQAKTRVNVKALRSVACSSDDQLFISNAVVPTVVHYADRGMPHTLALADLKGTLADNDIKIELTDDGRMKSINAVATGQGEAIIKAFSTLATTVAAVAKKAGPAAGACKAIKELGGGKPLTLTYQVDLKLDAGALAAPQELVPDAGTKDYDDAFGNALGKLCVTGTALPPPLAPAAGGTTGSTAVVKARQPGVAVLKMAVGQNACVGPEVWSTEVPVAQLGTDYEIPVPKPAWFGQNKLNATFSDSGALSSLQYSNSAGQAQAAGALNTVISAMAAGTTAQQTAAAKAEADLIVQEQRLVACLADRTSCK